jgi:hypothetical protein
MKTFFFIIIFLILLFTSCIKKADFDFGKNTKFVVVNGFFTIDKPIKVKITLSANALDSSVSYIDNAIVELWSKNEFIENLEYKGNSFYQTKNYLPEVEKEYTLKVKVEGFDEITATDYIPSETFFEISNNKGYTFIDERGYDVFTFYLSFNDEPNKNNFYEIFMPFQYFDPIFNDTTSGYYSLNTVNVIVKNENYFSSFSGDYYEIVSFSDRLITSGTANLNINYPYDTINLIQVNVGEYLEIKDTTTKILFTFCNISENSYKYKKSLKEIQEFNSNVSIDGQGDDYYLYSNVENGQGIFAGYNYQTDTLIYKGEIYHENN